MSGHLRGNWRGTKKSYMISYWPCEHKEAKSNTCALSEGIYDTVASEMQSTRAIVGVCILLRRHLQFKKSSLRVACR